MKIIRVFYYRSPGWVEFQTPDLKLEPAFASQKRILGEQSSLEAFINKYGDDNGRFLYQQFSSYRRHYSGLAYISTGISSDEVSGNLARSEAAAEGWAFDEVASSLSLLDRLVNGPWDADEFLVVPPGAAIRANFGEAIMEVS